MGSGAGFRRAVGVVLGTLLGGAGGTYACTLQLDGSIACGDGYVDRDAGEECDPLDRDSFIRACVQIGKPMGDGDCDPTTCTIIADRDQCAQCNDDEIDNGEECDGDKLGGKLCPGGGNMLQCTSECTLDDSECDKCGNDVVEPDEGEECEDTVGGLATPRPCAGSNLGGPGAIQPLVPPIPNFPYSYGDASTCDDCRFVRLGCSYCRNGRLDSPTPLDLQGNLSLQEVCDGDVIDLTHLMSQFPNSSCWANEFLRPNVGCADDCLDYVERDEPACCLQTGSPCPGLVGAQRCCYEYAHPDGEPCELIIDADNLQQQVCK